MKSKKQITLEDLITPDVIRAKEQIMLEWVLDTANEFYKIPENIKAFEAWLKNKNNKENVNYESTNNNF